VSRRRLSLVVVFATLAAACSSAPPGATSTIGPGSSAGAGASATLEPPVTFGPPPSPTQPDDTTPLSLDSSLLGILPEKINETPVTESLDEASQALSNATLSEIGSAVDAAVAVDTGNGDLVYAWVVKLRPGAFNDNVYRTWRDSYDEGACAAAGGVVGRAEATIDGRTVYVTSCVAGLRTYHVWLKDQDVLISASSLGDGHFGEVLMDNLRVPA